MEMLVTNTRLCSRGHGSASPEELDVTSLSVDELPVVEGSTSEDEAGPAELEVDEDVSVSTGSDEPIVDPALELEVDIDDVGVLAVLSVSGGPPQYPSMHRIPAHAASSSHVAPARKLASKQPNEAVSIKAQAENRETVGTAGRTSMAGLPLLFDISEPSHPPEPGSRRASHRYGG
jgi:hypothetical protein